MQNLPIAVGDSVRVRRERWRVVGVRPYDGCRLLALNGIGPRNRDVEKHVLLPFDLAEPIHHHRRVRFVGSRVWQRQCRRLIAAHGGADALRAARLARMDVLPHQLEAALAIVRGLTSRILIADDVGLGKTVQAGLIAAELIERGAVERVLVLTPAGLREQWVGEISQRFQLPFSLVDTAAIQRRRELLRPDVNPWSTFPMVVASVDYIKRPEVLPAVESCRWDLVIIDEAHGVVTAGDRHQAVSRLAARAPYVVLLTATPHNGDANAFASLRAIGSHLDTLMIFRRTRRDVGMRTDRRVRRLVVRPSDAECEMHTRLERFADAAQADHSERGSDVLLALSTLRKRALSSAFALYETVSRRLLALDDTGRPLEYQLVLPLENWPGEENDEDAGPRWTCPALHDPAAERALLGAVLDAAGAALSDQSKLGALHRLIRRIREPMVIFTEYRDTLLHMRQRVCPGAAILHGGLSRSERRAALESFNRGDHTVLMATDAAGEGLNLQKTCRVVINLELPWNPMRLEQRIGRVDRIGQHRRVHAIHLVTAAGRERAIVERLQQRLTLVRRDIGAPDPLGDGIDGDEAGVPTARIDATLEHQRLVKARRLMEGLPDRGEPPGSDRDTLVAIARPRIRARSGSRPLAVVRTILTDGGANLVAQEIQGLLLPVDRRPARWSRPEMRTLIDAIEAEVARRSVSTGVTESEWDGVSPERSAADVHAAFWKRRVEREQSILDAVMAQREPPQQPGLFGRHEPVATAAIPLYSPPDSDGAAFLRTAVRTALQTGERMRTVAASPAHVALLLVP